MAFNESKKFKLFMAKLYGFGASVVIVGAMFKIMHWPGSGILLVAGLSTEAIIFFFSAFEKPHQEPDWSLVYPELAGMNEGEIESVAKEESSSRRRRHGRDSSITEELDKMLEEAKIGPELIQSLGEGFKKFGENASKLADVSNTVIANEEFTKTIETATKAADQLKDSYIKTTEVLQKDIQIADEYGKSLKMATESANELSASYKTTSELIKEELAANEQYLKNVQMAANSAKQLAEEYIKSSESLRKSAEAIDFSKVDGESYAKQIQTLSKNLSALNMVYEMQLKCMEEQNAATNKLQETIELFVNNLHNSANDAKRFNDGLSQLANNISILNTIYGNMLSAMSTPIK